jgi:membrane protease YdiL (CAAX protease family)
MALALLPGFVRVELVPPRVLSEGAVPYGIGVGFPKVVVGVLVLGMIHPALLARTGLARVLASAAPVFLLTAGAAMLCVLALGYTAFAPKWTTLFLLWAPINLFFTCLSEEAFFRGFVQQELAGAEPARTRAIFALVAAAVLFGLAHFAGGVGYVLAATVAGLGYGWAFLRTGRIEAAIAVHFAVNAVHFLLFAYPRLKFLPGD